MDIVHQQLAHVALQGIDLRPTHYIRIPPCDLQRTQQGIADIMIIFDPLGRDREDEAVWSIRSRIYARFGRDYGEIVFIEDLTPLPYLAMCANWPHHIKRNLWCKMWASCDSLGIEYEWPENEEEDFEDMAEAMHWLFGCHDPIF